jgi:hypothetical protein
MRVSYDNRFAGEDKKTEQEFPGSCRFAPTSAIILQGTKMQTKADYEEPDVRHSCLYTLLIGGLLMTLPLYCGGVILIAIHQDATRTATPTMSSAILHLVTPTQTGTATLPPTFTPTPSHTPYIPRMTP